MMSAMRFYFNTVTIPEYLNKQLMTVNRIKIRNPGFIAIQLIDVISEEMKISAEKAEELLVLSEKEKMSLDDCNEECHSFVDIIPDYDAPIPGENLFKDEIVIEMDSLKKIIKTELKPRHAEYVKMHFGIGCRRMTYEEIAEEYCVGTSAVEKAVKAALAKTKTVCDN